MRAFDFYTHDDRHTVPSVQLVIAPSEESAYQLASARLAQSSHYRSVEVREGEELIFCVDQVRERPA